MTGADEAEIAKFDALAGRWWEPDGPMRELHAMNPARVGWMQARLQAAGLGGCTLVDVGCGAGIAAEAFAQLGHDVTGVDAAGQAVAAARAHAHAGGVEVTYVQGEIGDLARDGRRFGAVTALEVIEHVADQAGFVAQLARLLAPGGRLCLSTINRTMLSLATAKIGAEYVARMLPRGTHDWRRFVTPSELAGFGRACGLRVEAVAGLMPGPGGWRTGRGMGVNYLVCLSAD